NLVAGPTLRRKKKKPEQNGAPWTSIGEVGLSGGEMLEREISGEPVLFVKLANDLYAYRNMCPGCGESLEGGSLKVADLGCPVCGRRYDVRRAGRCLDDPGLHLEPVPLLVGDEGAVKIALPSAVG
ncbi:MAG TPA: Rieske 2Fe-2S domain-containing protein, partial [Rubrobacter sp.]|nr:Rieske 2Fe-2S domain-containing protein [Rubrobacter sp.]